MQVFANLAYIIDYKESWQMLRAKKSIYCCQQLPVHYANRLESSPPGHTHRQESTA